MSDRLRLARDTPVADCVDRLGIDPLVARSTDDLLEVLYRAGAQPETRLVAVVDDDGVLIGVSPVLRVAESVIARVAPDALLADITDLDGVARFGDEVEARTVGDVMLAPASISPNSTIDDAFRLMRKRHLSGLYVVDESGRPAGYLDLLELASLYAQTLDQRQEP